jgi:hypothetical protein
MRGGGTLKAEEKLGAMNRKAVQIDEHSKAWLLGRENRQEAASNIRFDRHRIV